MLFQHCSAGRALAVEAVTVDESAVSIGLGGVADRNTVASRSVIKNQKRICAMVNRLPLVSEALVAWGTRWLVKGVASTHSLKPPAPQSVVRPWLLRGRRRCYHRETRRQRFHVLRGMPGTCRPGTLELQALAGLLELPWANRGCVMDHAGLDVFQLYIADKGL